MTRDINWFVKLVPYEHVGGYFWLPGPLCGREFGGHEWRDIDGKCSSIPDDTDPHLSHGICPLCTSAGRGYRRGQAPTDTPDQGVA